MTTAATVSRASKMMLRNKIDSNSISDEEFVEKVVKLLKKNRIDAIERAAEFKVYTALPDRLDEFASHFINEENGSIKNLLRGRQNKSL